MPSDGADEDTVRRFEEALSGLPAVPTRAEVAVLLDVFPASDDTLFGAAWTLLHYVEGAPGWPYESMLDGRNWWVRFLRERAERGGRLPSA